MQLSIQSDLSRAARDVRALGKQAAFAQVVALTRTAIVGRDALRTEMRSVLDRPTPYTIQGAIAKPATKVRPEASVSIQDETSRAGTPGATYLGPQIEGGSRSIKRFEKRLQLDGVMQRGWFAVPGQYCKLDDHGNISRGQITQILSQLTRTKVSGYTANISARSRKGAIKRSGGAFFALPFGLGELQPGIYQTVTYRKQPRPIIIFVKSVNYTPKLDFYGVVERAVEAAYDANFDTALAQYAGGNQVTAP